MVDADLSGKDRAEVQSTMEGPEVLEVNRFPEIHFRSTTVQQSDESRWVVRGDLDLHGQRRPVVLEMMETGGRFLGTATLKIRDYGINPPAVVGGSSR